ncbi:uncharacterized protein PHALS_10485 [Plasmopara halstedii]|uniref:Uncharacterized protein n=1 Tax=Plasmopara halstedii TaxID=4781 RepID=A0A0N7L523_PLAHL|nr:uncharacterized protein PHALS_10485 [Plasmopara halstedii]CEG40275.1 hypothetical protein PHALS_10485 [Plasmopara halstedii]|eukprot:XP_024576644.1 hypothetical protein PHALS_10485 [Plasmopara halstedii]
MLREIGFWCSEDNSLSNEPLDTNRPNPRHLVDDAWFAEIDPSFLKTIEWYLTRAFVESYELAYSFCRFNCLLALEQPAIMGACTMTDGIYCWPEGYWHYVYHHHVKPPHDFLTHMIANHVTMVEITRRAREEKKLQVWDAVEKKAIEMPQAMQDWIILHTTIKSDL